MRQIVRGWFHEEPPAAEMDAMLADALLWPEQALFDLRASMEHADYRPRLGEIAAPTLVVHGEHDRGRPRSQAQSLADGVQHGRLVVLDCGHTPSQEAPAQFNRHFWAFMEAPSTAF